MNKDTKNKLIYIIDDDIAILSYLRKILINLEIEVEIFESPELFIKRLKEKIPDLCFIDINLGVNIGAGFQLIEAIRQKLSDTLVLIVLSGRDNSEDTTHALEIGGNDYIIKPIKPSIIESKVRQHLSHAGDLFSPLIAVPKELSACTFDLGFYLYQISESEFTILTQHFIPKKTNITFSSGILYEIMKVPFSLKAESNWIHTETGLYAVSFIFPNDDLKFKFAFRKWVLSRNTSKTNSLL